MEGNELSIVTNEILDRISYLKNCVKESMTIGEDYIIRGIILFEEVLKMLDPIEINEDIIKKIQMCVNDILHKKGMVFNNYYNLGINRCYFILYDYNIVQKKKKLG